MMFSKQELLRYSRQIILPEIGKEGQVKLKQAKVLVIGAGGLGCPVLQYLAAAGVGTIAIVDDDVVDESNLQRQVLYNTEDIGKPKAEVAVQKLAKLNPHITLTSHLSPLTSDNALSLITPYDLVVDGSDNFPTRYLVNDACVMLNKPLVFGSIFRFEGQVSVFNYKNGPTYRCLYPEPPSEGEVPNCTETGVLGVLPGIIGCLQANEVIKMITGTGEVLSGKLLIFDALNMLFKTYEFAANPKNKNIKRLETYEEVCKTTADDVPEMTAAELKAMIENGDDFQLIDVRESNEYQAHNIKGELIPLSTLADNLSRISRNKKIIVHCHSGVRSKTAVALLLQHGYKNVWNLKNGLVGFRL